MFGLRALCRHVTRHNVGVVWSRDEKGQQKKKKRRKKITLKKPKIWTKYTQNIHKSSLQASLSISLTSQISIERSTYSDAISFQTLTAKWAVRSGTFFLGAWQWYRGLREVFGSFSGWICCWFFSPNYSGVLGEGFQIFFFLFPQFFNFSLFFKFSSALFNKNRPKYYYSGKIYIFRLFAQPIHATLEPGCSPETNRKYFFCDIFFVIFFYYFLS